MLAGTIDAVVNIDRHAKSQFNAEQVGTFSMVGTEVGSKNRIADVTGTIEPNGWLNANIKGVGVACDHIKLLPLLTPAAPH